jgi:hypothetical protein
MYPLFSHVPASIVELGCFRGGKALISKDISVRFSSRFTAWTGGFGVATLGIEDSFSERLGNEIDSITGYAGHVGQRVMDAGMHG